ncbi:MAG: 2-C-methyl-D-erythritol 4-phosphate cytidylyltransferase [Bacteroidaceae bacterium]|nr:2-C-methyl-D-erythritol 4-phosphate cytidylyltransferase [Bacteroidaceae bacterium]
MTKRYAIIVAGGKGLRMGGDIPKQFIPIGGMPVLMHTMKQFYLYDSCIHLILVLPMSQQGYWLELCKEYKFDIPYKLANGGETRFHSVRNGLELVSSLENSLVAVHDGVRPFVSKSVIGECFDMAEKVKAVVPVVPMIETIRQISDEISYTVDRDKFCLVQTPQVFSGLLLKRAYQQPYSSGFTDDASVVEALGEHVTLVPGNRENIKITTPFDLKVANVLL